MDVTFTFKMGGLPLNSTFHFTKKINGLIMITFKMGELPSNSTFHFTKKLMDVTFNYDYMNLEEY